MSKPKNPSAFPDGKMFNGIAVNPGMSLRDYFAGQALMSMLSQPSNITDETGPLVARLSYEIADAMLAERERGQ